MYIAVLSSEEDTEQFGFQCSYCLQYIYTNVYLIHGENLNYLL